MYGDDWEYANSRLAGTIVRIGTEPVFVHQITPDLNARVAKLSNIQEDIVVELKDLNLKPVSLGMCNIDGVVSYLTRMPMRRDWKQGLRKGNFISMSGIAAHAIAPDKLGICIEGKYPSFQEACEKAMDKKRPCTVAWNREWAVHNGALMYKALGIVGSVIAGVPNLSQDYMYLRESLEESL